MNGQTERNGKGASVLPKYELDPEIEKVFADIGGAPGLKSGRGD
jgi:hypothetical protein